MAKKEKEVTLKDMNVEELRRRLEKNQQDLFKVRFRAAAAPLKNPMQIRNLRRDIARIHTFIKQRTTSENGPGSHSKSKSGSQAS